MEPADPTLRLDLEDPLLDRFVARVVGVEPERGAVLLDRTAFYPESGGQGADRGRLGAGAVVDVQIDRRGLVRHLVDGPLPAPGAEVEGRIDMARRRDFMAQHTGQHLLSRALLEVAEARTLSSRLGEGLCTLDVDREPLPAELLERAEARVDEVVDEDRRVRTWFPSPEELARLPLRRRPKVDRGVRVVDVGGFDLVACGGTHCTGTAQVGLLKVLGAERYKGLTRVTFVCGRRARARLSACHRVLAGLGRAWSCAPEDVPLAVERLARDLAAAQARLSTTRERLADEIAATLASAEAGELVQASLGDADVELLRAVGRRLASTGRVALLAAPLAEATLVLSAGGDRARFDCGRFLRSVAEATGGRGGGRPEHAEGRLPPGLDWAALVAAHAAAGRR